MLLVKSRSARLARDGISGLLWGLEILLRALKPGVFFEGGSP